MPQSYYSDLQISHDLFQRVFRHIVIAVLITPVILTAVFQRYHRALVSGIAEGDAGMDLQIFRKAQKLRGFLPVQGSDDAAADAFSSGCRSHAGHRDAHIDIAVSRYRGILQDNDI